jgi:CHAT domain-containing protein
MAELAGHFYRGLFEEGLSPGAALRAAQLELRRNPRWRRAHYWAAVKIEGDGLRPLVARP